ncbi:MAG: class I tRNA ligase family protein, partial [Deltaproteobacteria bacterium]|nr:class I tRNA ligase family protein [Deltaproteobacteria bacterium]
VEPKFGTGLMMVCTFGDIEDVIKWRKDNLETRIIMDDRSILNSLAGQYVGIKLSPVRQKIVDDLSKQGLVVKSTAIQHSVGVHDRCSHAVEFNIKPQWFIKILDFKDQFLRRGEQLKWFPEFMKVRYTEWVSNLKWDWNISRQRYYGVPFPVWYCKACNHTIIAAVNDLPVDPLTDKTKINNCPKCRNTDFMPETDVMDTWMTSSLTPLINTKWAYQDSLQDKIYPMSLRPQAFEIIRTWLFYTIVKSHFHTNSLPWEGVMISGWGLDDDGKKMSKSLGNFIAPEEVIDRYSADALRYWASGATLGHDLRYSEEDVRNGKRLLTKLWNAARFFSQNLGDFYPYQQIQPSIIDKWILSKLQDTIFKATESFENYEYSHALMTTERFFWDIYCDNYLEIIKDRFWNPEDYSGEAVVSTKDTMYKVFLNILKLFAPFLPYITEELYSIIYKKFENKNSIHTSSWPEVNVNLIDKEAESQGELLLTILKGVRKCKTDLKIHQNHWVSELVIRSTNGVQKEIVQITNDLKSAARAQKISFDKEAIFQTENPNR